MPLEGLHEGYINFYTDFAFKKLFGTEVNKELLRSFLNALLDGQEVITNLTYLTTEQLGTQKLARKAVFDIYCENEHGEKFLVEMQKAEQQFFKDRSVFYACHPTPGYPPQPTQSLVREGIRAALHRCRNRQTQTQRAHGI